MLKLKQMKIWLCWNYIEVKGKKTKKPVAAGDGATGTNKKYQKTWVTYDDAISAKQHMKADGIGFVIPVGYPIAKRAFLVSLQQSLQRQ